MRIHYQIVRAMAQWWPSLFIRYFNEYGEVLEERKIDGLRGGEDYEK